jgi:P27 family predicted phage terminase small subunit
MKPGPRPLPTPLHLVNGNPSKKSPRELAQEVKPDVYLPPPPDHLDEVAKAEWLAVGSELVRLGLISKIDAAAFEICCSLYSKWRKAERKIAELGDDGLVEKSPNGYLQIGAWENLSNRCVEKLRLYLNEFGRTPAARTSFTLLSPQLGLPFGDHDANAPTKAASAASRHFPD